jgi:hypothetical protein
MTTTKVGCSLTDEQVTVLAAASASALGRLRRFKSWSRLGLLVQLRPVGDQECGGTNIYALVQEAHDEYCA